MSTGDKCWFGRQAKTRYLTLAVFLFVVLLSWHFEELGIPSIPSDNMGNASSFRPPALNGVSVAGPEVKIRLNGTRGSAYPLQFVPDTTGEQLLPCTLDFIYKYSQKTGFVPHEGVWEGEEFPQFPHMKYHPKACTLPDPIVDFRKLVHFIGTTQVKRFVIIGSSQAHHYKKEFKEHLLQNNIYKCKRIRTEVGGAYNASYYVSNFTKEEDILIFKRLRCSSCKASMHQCSAPNDTYSTVNIETLVASHLLWPSFKTLRDPTLRNDCLSARRSPSVCYRSNNINEFYFREYLRAYPADVILWFIPLSHEIEGTSNRMVFTRRVRLFLEQVDKNMDNHTKIIWFPCHSHDQSKKPPPHNKRTYRGKTATQYINIYNRIFVRALQPYLAGDRRRHYLFLDLVAMSKPRLRDWSRDGVHMAKWWYRYVTGYAWHIMINSPEEWGV